MTKLGFGLLTYAIVIWYRHLPEGYRYIIIQHGPKINFFYFGKNRKAHLHTYASGHFFIYSCAATYIFRQCDKTAKKCKLFIFIFWYSLRRSRVAVFDNIQKTIYKTYAKILQKLTKAFSYPGYFIDNLKEKRKNCFQMPWRRGTVDIVSASGTEDPGSNPARV
jgi:hypothetical protein